MVPEALAERDLLARFYTDLCADFGLGRLLWLISTKFGLGLKLGSRFVPPHTRGLTRTSAWFSIGERIAHRIGKRFPVLGFRLHLAFTRIWAGQISRADRSDSTHVYAMFGEAGGYFFGAKRSGKVTVAEVLIMLSTEKRVHSEREKFPDWEPAEPNWPLLRDTLDPTASYLKSVDWYICPSQIVLEDLVQNWGVEPSRCKLVPYGMSERWLGLEQKTRKGRILFVGSACLRKGIHYLAEAAQLLKKRGRDYQFVVAGGVTDTVRNQDICANLEFLGRIPRDGVEHEYQLADVFVLPSLAEGSAEVTYEALAAGVPQVVSKWAGSVISNGIQGYVMSDCDPEELAYSIERIVEDRALRSSMSNEARNLAKEYVWPKYANNLRTALLQL